MKIKKNLKINCCPKCGCGDFISEPNQYDILRFNDGKFELTKTEHIDETIKIFCRDCGAEIDEQLSEEKRKIILKLNK